MAREEFNSSYGIWVLGAPSLSKLPEEKRCGRHCRGEFNEPSEDNFRGGLYKWHVVSHIKSDVIVSAPTFLDESIGKNKAAP
jgi:hypothetical protein